MQHRRFYRFTTVKYRKIPKFQTQFSRESSPGTFSWLFESFTRVIVKLALLASLLGHHRAQTPQSSFVQKLEAKICRSSVQNHRIRSPDDDITCHTNFSTFERFSARVVSDSTKLEQKKKKNGLLMGHFPGFYTIMKKTRRGVDGHFLGNPARSSQTIFQKSLIGRCRPNWPLFGQ